MSYTDVGTLSYTHAHVFDSICVTSQVLRVSVAGGSSGVLPENEGPMVVLVQVC